MKHTTEEKLDVLTLIEPLACVQHAYQRLPETFIPKKVLVIGSGPIRIGTGRFSHPTTYA